MVLTNVLDRKYSALSFFCARWLSYASGIFLTIEPGDSFWVYALRVLLDHPLFPNN
jgi:hypothetical protein